MGNPTSCGGAILRAAMVIIAMAGAIMVCVEGATVQSDVEALRALAKTNPNINKTGAWTGDPCDDGWSNVGCGSSSRVQVLSLTKSNFTGPIPPELGNLSSLSILELCCGLTGPIPVDLGNLSELTELDLSGNALTGLIPAELGNLSKLTELNLGDNALTGSIPVELGNLSLLRLLKLSDNFLTGPIPTALGNLSLLVLFYLQNNALTGPIPVELGNLSKLKALSLGNNTLTGSIPVELGNLSLLSLLALSGNSLTGPIPAALGNLSLLVLFYLDNNALTGPIPVELGNLSLLKFLLLSGNNLSGPIPAALGNLSLLELLFLDANSLSGPIPVELGNLSSLTFLSLYDNSLTGPIPVELGNLSKLTNLFVSDNTLTGPIPPELGRLSLLTFLSLENNALTGPIPGELGNMSGLATLVLSNNALTGPIPGELGNMSGLATLLLSNNNLTGPIPLGVSKWPNSTDLTRNYLNGASPGFAVKFSLNCFNMNSSHVFEAGQRDAGACAAYYPELQCNCTAPEAVGIDGSCYCVKPLRFAANFTAIDAIDRSLYSKNLGFFSSELSTTMANLSRMMGVPYEQVAALDFSDDGVRTVTLQFNVLPFSGARNFTSFWRDQIRRQADIINNMKTGNLNITGFLLGPNSLVEEELLFLAPPPPPPLLLPPPPPKPKDVPRRPTTLIVATSVGATAVVVAALGIGLWLQGRHTTRLPLRLTIQDTPVKQWKLAELQAATNNFDKACEIGKGGFATVYKADLEDVTVAVKRLLHNSARAEGQDEFVKEVKIIGHIHNRNLLALRGYCMEGDECLLVYEYMANGSLQDHLFKNASGVPLDWPQCVNILLGAASGIAYLHEGCKEKIIHRDIKPANILLDENFCPHVADFGLVRSALVANTHVSTKVAGTLGYLAPEYAFTGQLTEKSDVFSFGVLALVVIGHRQAIDTSGADDYIAIVERAFKAAEDGRLLDLVAPHLSNAYNEDQAKRLISIALLCTQPAWQERPPMGRVVQMMNGNVGVPAANFRAMASQIVRASALTSDSSSSQGASSTGFSKSSSL